jgi:ATP-dependent Clp protease ATP-binding subunit ClpA
MLKEILSKINLKHGGLYEEKFGKSGWRVLEHALDETRRRGQNYLMLGHLLNALAVENPDIFKAVMSSAKIKPAKAREFIQENLESIPKGTWRGVRIAPEVTALFRRAEQKAQKSGRRIEATDLGQVLAQGKLEFPRFVNWKVE